MAERVDHFQEALELLSRAPAGNGSYVATAHVHAVLTVAEEIRALRLALAPTVTERQR